MNLGKFRTMTTNDGNGDDNKFIVDLDELEKAFEFLRTINKKQIQNIKWQRGGVEVETDPALVSRWQYIGLNNTEFPRVAWAKPWNK